MILGSKNHLPIPCVISLKTNAASVSNVTMFGFLLWREKGGDTKKTKKRQLIESDEEHEEISPVEESSRRWKCDTPIIEQSKEQIKPTLSPQQ